MYIWPYTESFGNTLTNFEEKKVHGDQKFRPLRDYRVKHYVSADTN